MRLSAAMTRFKTHWRKIALRPSRAGRDSTAEAKRKIGDHHKQPSPPGGRSPTVLFMDEGRFRRSRKRADRRSAPPGPPAAPAPSAARVAAPSPTFTQSEVVQKPPRSGPPPTESAARPGCAPASGRPTGTVSPAARRGGRRWPGPARGPRFSPGCPPSCPRCARPPPTSRRPGCGADGYPSPRPRPRAGA